MAQSSYSQWFQQRMDRISPQAELSQIFRLPRETGVALLQEILKTGCLSGNEANILLARQAIAKLPADWLQEALPQAAQCLFQQPEWREWEFRRLAEMIQAPFPRCFAWLIGYVRRFQDPEIEQAISDFMEYPQGEERSAH